MKNENIYRSQVLVGWIGKLHRFSRDVCLCTFYILHSSTTGAQTTVIRFNGGTVLVSDCAAPTVSSLLLAQRLRMQLLDLCYSFAEKHGDKDSVCI